MSQELNNLSNLETLLETAEQVERVKGNLALALSWTGIMRYVNNSEKIGAANNLLDQMETRNIEKTDQRYIRTADWLKSLEERAEESRNLYAWFRTIATNEGANTDYLPNTAKVWELINEVPETEEEDVEELMEYLGCDRKEAVERIQRSTPEINYVNETLIENAIQNMTYEVTEISNSAAISLFNKAADKLNQYLESKTDQFVGGQRQRRSRRPSVRRKLGADMKLLQKMLEYADEEYSKLEELFQQGTQQAGESEYDSDHGTMSTVA